MAASDDFEYYLGFYTGYRHPFGVTQKERITKEEAGKEGTYVLVKRDEKNKIVTIIKVLYDKCFFHHEYTYEKDGSLATVGIVDCTDRPILEHLEGFFSEPPKYPVCVFKAGDKNIPLFLTSEEIKKCAPKK